MKVVLFCGGLGMRLRDYAENIPKPMVTIGYRPILWHVMKYYAHHGHKDFLLCLGYGADVIKSYVLNYSECLSNDFVLSQGGKQVQLLSSDIHDWKITFADTGTTSNIGQRLKAVEPYLAGEETFLANYSDGLTDVPLPAQIEHFLTWNRIASFLSVKPNLSCHFIATETSGLVNEIRDVKRSDIRINGGYFVFHRDIFKYIREGEELLEEPFQRLLDERQLVAFKYDGFWACMDTFKDKQLLEDLHARGKAPWEVWKNGSAASVPTMTSECSL
ncbi:MAG: glucose-1-phosphate cytidylyltransferase [Nitrospiraceae bacterium]